MQKILTFFVLFICLRAEFAIHFAQAKPCHWQKIENYLPGLIEGDIIPSDKPIDRKRIWPDGIIYYRFDRVYDESDIAAVTNVMKYIQSVSCIHFREAFQPSPYHFLDINMKNRYGRGCYASFGYRSQHVLNLDKGFCMSFGTILHQLLHSLGLWHQHNVPNRDQYIEIIEENIIPGFEDVFKIDKNDKYVELNVPYDYYSIMHYTTTAYSKNDSLLTIRVKDPSIHKNAVGRQCDLSPGDIEKLNKLYQCY